MKLNIGQLQLLCKPHNEQHLHWKSQDLLTPLLCFANSIQLLPQPTTFQKNLEHHTLMMLILLSPIIKAGSQRPKHKFKYVISAR